MTTDKVKIWGLLHSSTEGRLYRAEYRGKDLRLLVTPDDVDMLARRFDGHPVAEPQAISQAALERVEELEREGKSISEAPIRVIFR